MSCARTLIRTGRLELVAPDPVWATAALDYFRRNQAHLSPWDPPRPAEFLSPDFQRQRLEAGAVAFAAGTAWLWWLRSPGVPGRLIGHLHFSQVVRGPFQNAMLGYSIDADFEGQGLMREALAAALAEVFSATLDLHRVQANVRPDNLRSLRLLQRLGFEQEGLARDYLFIDGAWRDHVMTALRNPAFSGNPGL